MKTKTSFTFRLIAATFLAGGMLITGGCTKISEPMDLDVTLVGLYNTTNKWPASNGTTDAIFVLNDQYDDMASLKTDYQLKWDGKSFSASYTDVYLAPNSQRMTTVVEISGEFSSNYKTLISYNGTRTLTKLDLVVGGGTDIVECRISLHDVPIEVESDNLRAFITGSAQKYVTSAYWRHTTINPSTTVTSETGDLDFSDAATELNITFDKVY